MCFISHHSISQQRITINSNTVKKNVNRTKTHKYNIQHSEMKEILCKLMIDEK